MKRIIKDKWNNEFPCDDSVNSTVDHVEIKRECECCLGAPVHAHMFVVKDGERVYSDPPFVLVGQRTPRGTREFISWRNDLRDNKINSVIAEYIETFFREHSHEY
jgi:hypothetical protein